MFGALTLLTIHCIIVLNYSAFAEKKGEDVIDTEVKSILDSKFYLTKKIGQGSSGKVYLGFPKESLNDKIENIRYYSIKI